MHEYDISAAGVMRFTHSSVASDYLTHFILKAYLLVMPKQYGGGNIKELTDGTT